MIKIYHKEETSYFKYYYGHLIFSGKTLHKYEYIKSFSKLSNIKNILTNYMNIREDMCYKNIL